MVVVLYKWWCWCISSLWWSCITGGDGVFICHGDVLVMMRWLWWCIGGGGVCGVASVEVVLLYVVLLGMGYCMWWCVSGGGGGDGSLILLLMWILKCLSYLRPISTPTCVRAPGMAGYDTVTAGNGPGGRRVLIY